MISKVLNIVRGIGLFSSIVFVLYISNLFSYGYIFGYLLIILIVIKADFIRKNLDFYFLLLFFFSIVYGLFYSFEPIAGNQYIFIYMFAPPFLYLWGKFFMLKTFDSESIFYVLIIIATIFSFPAMISILHDIYQGGFVQPTRSIPMFWSSEPTSATVMGMMLVFNMCIPAILITSVARTNLFFKVLLSGVFILSLACILRLGSRTQLVVSLFSFLVSLIYIMPKQTFKQNLGLFGLLAVATYLVFRNVSFDLDADWLNSFAGRMQNSGGQGIASGGGRTERWVKSFQYLFEKPLGWSVSEFGFSHNLWLDVLRVGGIISFFLLIILSIKSFFLVKKTIAVNPKNTSFNTLILTHFIALFLVFMVEPIIEGAFTLFVIFCFYNGILSQYISLKYKT